MPHSLSLYIASKTRCSNDVDQNVLTRMQFLHKVNSRILRDPSQLESLMLNNIAVHISV